MNIWDSVKSVLRYTPSKYNRKIITNKVLRHIVVSQIDNALYVMQAVVGNILNTVKIPPSKC